MDEKPFEEKPVEEVIEEIKPQPKTQEIGVYKELQLTEKEKDIIRKSPGYIKLKSEEGSEFADAVYFGINK